MKISMDRLESGALARLWPRALALAALDIALLNALTWVLPNIWWAVAVSKAVSGAAAFLLLPVGWRHWLRPTPAGLLIGVAGAVALYFGGWLGLRLLVWVSPGLQAEAAAVFAWSGLLPPLLALPLLFLLIIPGEEVVWRVAVAQPLAARWGVWAGTLLASAGFALAHLSFGSTLIMLAGLGLGAFWVLLTRVTRSVVPALVSHLLWDLAVLFVWPYT